jgi:hypothetical protein
MRTIETFELGYKKESGISVECYRVLRGVVVDQETTQKLPIFCRKKHVLIIKTTIGRALAVTHRDSVIFSHYPINTRVTVFLGFFKRGEGFDREEKNIVTHINPHIGRQE